MWSMSTWNSTCGRYILVLITAPINQTYLYIAMHIPYGRGEVRLFTPFFSLFSLPTALCFVFSYPFVIMPPFYSFYGCNQLLPNLRVSIGCLMFHTASNASYGIEPAAIGQCQPLLTHQHLIHIADTDMFPPLLYFLVSSFLYIFFTSWLVVSCISMCTFHLVCVIFLTIEDLHWYCFLAASYNIGRWYSWWLSYNLPCPIKTFCMSSLTCSAYWYSTSSFHLLVYLYCPIKTYMIRCSTMLWCCLVQRHYHVMRNVNETGLSHLRQLQVNTCYMSECVLLAV